MTTTVHVLRVFTTPSGEHGNPLGVVLDGASVAPKDRQPLATHLAYSETVFVLDADASLEIYTPGAQLPFAGHPLVGTSWLMQIEGRGADVLRPPAGAVPTWVDPDGLTWIRGRAAWSPVMEIRQLEGEPEVDASTPPDAGFLAVWAWTDEQLGVVRARCFPADVGIVEDEATGSFAVRLATQLDRPITIRQGRGSVLHARPGADGTAEVGGLTVLDDVRQL